jgi:hypothetical protein
MKKAILQNFLIVVVILAILLTGLGGLMDMTGREKIGFLSKQHAWNDGLFLLILAILLSITMACSS